MHYNETYIITPKFWCKVLFWLLARNRPWLIDAEVWRIGQGGDWQPMDLVQQPEIVVKYLFLASQYARFTGKHSAPPVGNKLIRILFGELPIDISNFDKWWNIKTINFVNGDTKEKYLTLEEMNLFETSTHTGYKLLRSIAQQNAEIGRVIDPADLWADF